MGKEKDKDKDQGTVDDETTPEELEKALDIALSKLEKANKAPPPPADEEDDKDEEEEKRKEKEKLAAKKSEEEPDFEELSKSLEESVAEKDEDASDVLDGIPFVKSLVSSLDGQLVELVKAVVYLSDKVEAIEAHMEETGDLNKSEAKLIKSISENIRKMSETPLPRKAKISEIEIMKKSETGEEIKGTMTKAMALVKLTELHKADKISLKEVVACEGQIQRGVAVPENIQALLSV
ncbi:hypothetical protein LCGC14_1113990 [marine sediment metagenome]|uniref:Uncharacterized protein n=1 Tax=marine sediment metagenome TaxID=412755 RepID=A0A0F9MAQ3_9ZZZZ